MAAPDKSDTNIDPKENGRKNRDQGQEKKRASDGDEVATNPDTDPEDLDSARRDPANTPDADDRLSV